MYTLGEEIFFYRAGPIFFLCHLSRAIWDAYSLAAPDLTSHTGAAEAWGVGPPTGFLRSWYAPWDGGCGIASASSDGLSCKWAPKPALPYKLIWR